MGRYCLSYEPLLSPFAWAAVDQKEPEGFRADFKL